MSEREHAGGCACGAVRIAARGDPYRVGLCHCLTCRKRHGAPFNAFAVFPADKVEVAGGELGMFRHSDTQRFFCRDCGSPVYSRTPGSDEIELFLGSFDEIGLWAPTYEAWVPRREGWLPGIPSLLCRYEGNRTGPQRTEP